MLWNVYNRITIKYEIASEPEALEPVRNPHFTYHPGLMFHLKSNADRADQDESIFEGIVDVKIVLWQQERMPWIRVTSAPLNQLRLAGSRVDGILIEDLILRVPSKELSVQIAIDLIRRDAAGLHDSASSWSFAWGDVAVQLTASYTYPHIATLAWFHSY